MTGRDSPNPRDRRPPGATLLAPEEADALIPGHVRTRQELFAWEQVNILEAQQWARRARGSALEESTIRELHRRMFDRTWEWAGRYRLSDKNIGVGWTTIPAEVRKLVDDGAFWIHEQTFPPDEIVIRLHHRLVQIHPFPDGNGRHARLWCDLLLRQNGRPAFDWKNERLGPPGEARRAYIDALRAADAGDFQPLGDLLLVGRH
jgi:Fic-DOC domain mobile mystery protein B